MTPVFADCSLLPLFATHNEYYKSLSLNSYLLFLLVAHNKLNLFDKFIGI